MVFESAINSLHCCEGTTKASFSGLINYQNAKLLLSAVIEGRKPNEFGFI